MSGNGNKSSSGGRERGGGLNPNDIKSTSDMIVERGEHTASVDEVLTVSRDFYNEYGDSVPLNQFLIAEMKPKANDVLGYYDGANIAINRNYLDNKKMANAYEDCVKSGYHPKLGNKSAMAAVTAHEFGHAATDAVAAKLGYSGLNKMNQAADRIVKEARKKTQHRGVVKMSAKISRYATSSNAEAIAEAVADVYCNGKKAAKESRAIVDVMNSYLK